MTSRCFRSCRLTVVLARAAWRFHASRLRYVTRWQPPLHTFRDARQLLCLLAYIWRDRAPI